MAFASLSDRHAFFSSVLVNSSTAAHSPLLQCSQRVLYAWWILNSSTTSSRVGLHARAKGFERVKERTQRDVTSQPTSSTPVQGHRDIRDSQSRSTEGQGTSTSLRRELKLKNTNFNVIITNSPRRPETVPSVVRRRKNVQFSKTRHMIGRSGCMADEYKLKSAPCNNTCGQLK